MGGRFWKDKEVAIIVYFASRRVDHDSCQRLLEFKTSTTSETSRTAYAIRAKLDSIKDKHAGLWSQDAGWNVDAVDNWLLGLRISNLAVCLSVGETELQLISLVSCSARLLKAEVY